MLRGTGHVYLLFNRLMLVAHCECYVCYVRYNRAKLEASGLSKEEVEAAIESKHALLEDDMEKDLHVVLLCCSQFAMNISRHLKA